MLRRYIKIASSWLSCLLGKNFCNLVQFCLNGGIVHEFCSGTINFLLSGFFDNCLSFHLTIGLHKFFDTDKIGIWPKPPQVDPGLEGSVANKLKGRSFLITLNLLESTSHTHKTFFIP